MCSWTLKLSFVALCCSLIGCGSQTPTYQVNGKVVFSDGTPVQFGDIETLAAEQRVNARGKIQKDGTFTLTTFTENDGAVAGQHKVIIMQSTAVPLAANAKMGPVKHDHGHDLGSKYRSYDTSGLSFTVQTTGKNEVVLTIDDFKPATSGH